MDKYYKNTNIYDVIIAIINFVMNLFSPKKVICISVLYMTVIQNLVFIFNSRSYEEMSKYSYKDAAAGILTAFIKEQQPIVILILTAIIIFLFSSVVSLIIHTRVLRKEIDRLAAERKELLHSSRIIGKHRSSQGEE